MQCTFILNFGLVYIWFHSGLGHLSPFYPRILSLAPECSVPSEASTDLAETGNMSAPPHAFRNGILVMISRGIIKFHDFSFCFLG